MPRLRLAIFAAFVSALFVLAPPAHAAGTAYVLSDEFGDSSTISQYAIGADGRLSPRDGRIAAPQSGSLAISPNDRSAYAASGLGVFQFDVDPLSGALAPKVPALVPADPEDSFFEIAVTPNGKFAYAAYLECCHAPPWHLARFEIDPSSGALSPSYRFAGCGGGVDGAVIAVSPDGRSLYTTSYSEAIFQCDIDPLTGALSPKTPPRLNLNEYGDAFSTLIVAPGGRSAYVLHAGDGFNADAVIVQYDIDPASGALSPKNPALITTGPIARFGAITPDGRSLYVSSMGIGTRGVSGSIWQYDIDPASGTLSPKNPAFLETGWRPGTIAVTPDGRSAYVASSDNNIRQFDIDSVSGALSPKTPPTVATDGYPGKIVIGPFPRLPTGNGECKGGGWKNFPQFKNQGQCVAFVAHRK